MSKADHDLLMRMAEDAGEAHVDLILRLLFSAGSPLSSALGRGARRHRTSVFYAFGQLNKLTGQLNRAGGLLKLLHSRPHPPDPKSSWREIENIAAAVDEIRRVVAQIPLAFVDSDDAGDDAEPVIVR